MSPFINVLIKIFVKGFYREHGGMLLFLFVSLICYCFFIYTIHIPPSQSLVYNLIFMLTFVSTPLMTIVVFVIWLLYAVKVLKYMLAQIRKEEHQFLFYSTTSMDIRAQFLGWCVVLSLVLLPVLIIAVAAYTVGMIFQYYTIPHIILMYAVLLIAGSAGINVMVMNRLAKPEQRGYLLSLVSRWPKPIFTVFLYNVLEREKVTYLVTKLVGLGLTITMYQWYLNEANFRIIHMLSIGLACTHVIVIFHYFVFDNTCLSFSKNFPYPKYRHLLNFLIQFLILASPEILTLFKLLEVTEAISALSILLATSLFLYAILYRIGSDMTRYLKIVFALFVFLFMMAIIDIILPISVVLFFLAIGLFNRYYEEAVAVYKKG